MIEPSNIERANLPDTTRDYLHELERELADARLHAAALILALEALLPILDNDGPLPRVYADVGTKARRALSEARKGVAK